MYVFGLCLVCAWYICVSVCDLSVNVGDIWIIYVISVVNVLCALCEVLYVHCVCVLLVWYMCDVHGTCMFLVSGLRYMCCVCVFVVYI